MPPAFLTQALWTVVRASLVGPGHAQGTRSFVLCQRDTATPSVCCFLAQLHFRCTPMSPTVVMETRLDGEEARHELEPILLCDKDETTPSALVSAVWHMMKTGCVRKPRSSTLITRPLQGPVVPMIGTYRPVDRFQTDYGISVGQFGRLAYHSCEPRPIVHSVCHFQLW